MARVLPGARADLRGRADQLAGLAIGALIGWGVPYVMHFRRGAGGVTQTGALSGASNSSRAIIVPMPMVLDHGAGLGLTGIY